MNQTSNTYEEHPQISFLKAFSLGLKVILSEIHWNILRGLRTWEIRQLQNKLNKEYQNIGRIIVQKDKNNSIDEEEENLSKNQIEFLEKEINFLHTDLQKLRENQIKKRRQKWQL